MSTQLLQTAARSGVARAVGYVVGYVRGQGHRGRVLAQFVALWVLAFYLLCACIGVNLYSGTFNLLRNSYSSELLARIATGDKDIFASDIQGGRFRVASSDADAAVYRRPSLSGEKLAYLFADTTLDCERVETGGNAFGTDQWAYCSEAGGYVPLGILRRM
jgi:hypothetical protein